MFDDWFAVITAVLVIVASWWTAIGMLRNTHRSIREMREQQVREFNALMAKHERQDEDHERVMASLDANRERRAEDNRRILLRMERLLGQVGRLLDRTGD